MTNVIQFPNIDSYERHMMIRVVDSLENCPKLAKDLFRQMALEYDIGRVCSNYRYILKREKDFVYYENLTDSELLGG